MIHLGGPRLADIPDLDLASFTLRGAQQLGDKPALIDGASGRSLTYAELERSVRSMAAGLATRGFAKGDTFGICMPNMPEFAVAFHGVVAAGGRCTTANPLYTAGELVHQLVDTNTRMLLTVPTFLEVAREAAAKADCELYVVGEAEGAIPFSALLGDPEAAPRVVFDPVHDIAAILYSGGTTGLPKGVLLSHRNVIANLAEAGPAFGVTSDDVVIAVLPFFHVYGLNVILNQALIAGATVVSLPRFELGPFLDLLERYRVTRGYVVPPIALALVNDPAVEGRDLSALRHVLSAAAPLGVELAEACERRIGCRVSQAYGMTEMSSATHVAPPFGDVRKPGSIGPPIPGTECRLVDPDTGADVAPGQPGELCLRGPHVMYGYLNNPEATAAMIDQDGWLRSGDIAVVDEDGWFTVIARVKEIIKYKGFQVAPAELEAILVGHPQVADCAVIGIADKDAGEIPKAFVVPAGDQLDAESVLQFVRDRVAPHKRIRAIEVVEEIPKSPSGRILRRVLEERERSR
ncbi:MAG TPA: AMP-binding protein [Jiangellaceae bacterium]|nr:AMP-binding protein [Jiangellaceae bacterium]